MRGQARDVLRRSALRWAAGLVIVLASCQGGGDSFGFGVGGSSGAGGVSGTPSEGVSGGSASGPTTSIDVHMPYVACSLPNTDAGDDDADAAEAGAPDGGRPFESDAGDSPCSVDPPPDCVDETTMVTFHLGACHGERCYYSTEFIACPGGCFRQIDGGHHCNE